MSPRPRPTEYQTATIMAASTGMESRAKMTFLDIARGLYHNGLPLPRQEASFLAGTWDPAMRRIQDQRQRASAAPARAYPVEEQTLSFTAAPPTPPLALSPPPQPSPVKGEGAFPYRAAFLSNHSVWAPMPIKRLFSAKNAPFCPPKADPMRVTRDAQTERCYGPISNDERWTGLDFRVILLHDLIVILLRY